MTLKYINISLLTLALFFAIFNIAQAGIAEKNEKIVDSAFSLSDLLQKVDQYRKQETDFHKEREQQFLQHLVYLDKPLLHYLTLTRLSRFLKLVIRIG